MGEVVLRQVSKEELESNKNSFIPYLSVKHGTQEKVRFACTGEDMKKQEPTNDKYLLLSIHNMGKAHHFKSIFCQGFEHCMFCQAGHKSAVRGFALVYSYAKKKWVIWSHSKAASTAIEVAIQFNKLKGRDWMVVRAGDDPQKPTYSIQALPESKFGIPTSEKDLSVWDDFKKEVVSTPEEINRFVKILGLTGSNNTQTVPDNLPPEAKEVAKEDVSYYNDDL